MHRMFKYHEPFAFDGYFNRKQKFIDNNWTEAQFHVSISTTKTNMLRILWKTFKVKVIERTGKMVAPFKNQCYPSGSANLNST